jgi:hypothetical protein
LATLLVLLIPGALAAGPYDLDSALSVDDVLRLHNAGLSDDVIISEIVVTGTVFELSVDELLRLKEAGLSDRLIQFMVDTAFPEADPEDESGDLSEDEATGQDYEDYEWYPELDTGESEWVNVIEEETEPTVVYHYSLNWGYPSWWYDYYWDDYWYWGWSFPPYRVSYVHGYGYWYPAWYTARYCYGYPYYGYRLYCGSHYGYAYYGGWYGWYRHGYHHGHGHYHGYYDGHYYDYWDGHGDYYAGRHGHLSDRKYKTRRTGGHSGKLVHSGLKVPKGGDVSGIRKELASRDPSERRKVRKDRVLMADADRRMTDRDRIRRPVRADHQRVPVSRVDRGDRGRYRERTPVKVERRPPTRVRTPVRVERKPARIVTPPKKRVLRPSGKTSVPLAPKESDRPGKVERKPRSGSERGAGETPRKVTPRVVKPKPSKPESKPGVSPSKPSPERPKVQPQPKPTVRPKPKSSPPPKPSVRPKSKSPSPAKPSGRSPRPSPKNTRSPKRR